MINPYFSRTSADSGTTAKVLEAYLCTGDPYWPLGMSNQTKHSVVKTSIIIAHFLICNQTRHFPDADDYNERMLHSMIKAVPGLTMNTKINSCLKTKVECQIYEHVCGTNNVWNSWNAVQFLLFNLENSTNEEFKSVKYALSFVLMKNNLETLLSSISSKCPDKSNCCDLAKRNRRNVYMENEVERLVEPNVHLRRKRLYGPSQMKIMLDQVICDEEIMSSLAEYWDKQCRRFPYSRVWIMGIVSQAWCCFVET